MRSPEPRFSLGEKNCGGGAKRRCPILVLGIGNILLCDEGVGVRVIEALQTMELPATVEVFDGATAGVDLLDVLADRRKVIVIDAVQADGPCGAVFRFTPPELEPQQHVAFSLHQVGFLEALKMTQLIGSPPEQVVIFGVKPQNVGYGLGLSNVVSRAIPEVVELVLFELRT